MPRPKVDIGIACSGSQAPVWWSRLMAELIAETSAGNVELGQIHAIASASPDHNKNHVVDDRRSRLTDSNRQEITGNFLDGDSEWIWWIDDDTIPPKGALSHLLSLDKEAVGGLYFQGQKPYPPLAYMRDKQTGAYSAIWHYPHGALFQVDSIGMGCTLTHRSLFEKIRDNFTVFQRMNGSLFPVHNSKVGCNDIVVLGENAPDIFIANGYMLHRIIERDPKDNRAWPFFAMEYGRTEDHYFWELAIQVGVRPWVDTALTCQHRKAKEYGLEDYWSEREAWLAQRIEKEWQPKEVEVISESA